MENRAFKLMDENLSTVQMVTRSEISTRMNRHSGQSRVTGCGDPIGWCRAPLFNGAVHLVVATNLKIQHFFKHLPQT